MGVYIDVDETVDYSKLELDKQLLKEFHEKAERCSNKDQMRRFCQSFLRKHGEKHNDLKLPTPQNSHAAVEHDLSYGKMDRLTVQRCIDRRTFENSISPSITIAETKVAMVDDLKFHLLEKNYISFSEELDPMQDRKIIRATIFVGARL